MTQGNNLAPDQKSIWNGAILGSIAHAVAVARYPDLSHEQSWDAGNYNIQDSAGSRGTIAFKHGAFVAVFFLQTSPRNPFRSQQPYDINPFLLGLPEQLKPIANDEALQYVLQDYQGTARPIITSAFWGNGVEKTVTAAEPWVEVIKHGAVLIRNQLLEPPTAITRWAEDYEFTPAEVILVKSIYDRKTSNPEARIVLGSAERTILEAFSQGSEGLETSRESFSELGIELPE